MLKTMILFMVLCAYNSVICELEFPRIVWTHWDNDSLPEDIEEMVDVTRNSLTNFTYYLLTPRNISKFLEIVSFPDGYKKLHIQGKSDYIRVCVSEKYGGFYVDSSTYVTSQSNMEWFYTEAVKSQKQIVVFEGPKKGHFFRSCFLGVSKSSEFMKEFKRKWDTVLKENVLKKSLREYAVHSCANFLPTPTFCQNKWQRSYFIVYIILEEGLRENVLMRKEEVLVLPEHTGPMRLTSECKSAKECVRNRLLYDPIARKYPFIKVVKNVRDGKKFGMRQVILEEWVPTNGRSWKKVKKKMVNL